jgi:hypothetical protein
MKIAEKYFFHRLAMFTHYINEMKRACIKTNQRVDYLGCDILNESLIVRFNAVRSLFRNPGEPNGFHFATVPFVIGFYSSETIARPTRIIIRSPRGAFAHPNSDGVGVCLGEALPRLLPAEMMLLHVYRVITFQKYNLASAVNADAVRYVLEQPPETFPSDRTPLF